MSMKRRIKKQMHAANAAFANNADVVLVRDVASAGGAGEPSR